MTDLKKSVFRGKYYWSHKDRPCLRLAYETIIPSDFSDETLIDWSYHYREHQRQVIGFSYFLLRDHDAQTQ